MGIKRFYLTIVFITLLVSSAWCGKRTDSIHVTGGANINRCSIDSVTISGGIFYPGIYGDIHNHDSTFTQAIPNGATYTKLTCFPSNGPCQGVTCDTANDKLTILKTGKYRVNLTLSFGGTSNTTFRGVVFLGITEQENVHFARKLSTGGDIGSASASGIISVSSVPQDMDVRVRHDQGGSADITARILPRGMQI